MNILFIISDLGDVSKGRFGGAERVASLLCNSWAESNHVTLILSSACCNKSPYFLSERVAVVPLLSDDGRRKHFLYKVHLLRKQIKKIKPNVIVTFFDTVSLLAFLASRPSRIPLVTSERNAPSVFPKKHIWRLLRLFLYHNFDGVVFQTRGARDFFSNQIVDKSIIIENPLVLDNLPNSNPHRFHGGVFVSVGRLDPQKQFDFLISTFVDFHRLHPSSTLIIYGEGCERSSLSRLIENCGASSFVRLGGFASDVFAVLNDADFFVSASAFEGFPNALVEAAAYGIPCIATDCPDGGSKAVLIGRDKGHQLFPVNDASNLLSCMEFSISNYPMLRSRAMEYSNSLRERLSCKIVSGKWLSYLSSFLNK